MYTTVFMQEGEATSRNKKKLSRWSFLIGAITETNARYESPEDFQLIAKSIAANGGHYDVHCNFAQ